MWHGRLSSFRDGAEVGHSRSSNLWGQRVAALKVQVSMACAGEFRAVLAIGYCFFFILVLLLYFPF